MERTILLLMAVLCITACKKEPDLPADPHVPLLNPFIGVWNVGEEYWQFNRDGTGGRAAAEMGPFPDDFSFFIYAGQDVQTTPSEGILVMLDDSNGEVLCYDFLIAQNRATLSLPGQSMTMERISSAPYALSLTNQLIGEWSAQWTGSHGDSNTWSFKYRSDGTVKAYHHGSHQFENGYVLRGNTLVIFGIWRFGIEPVVAQIHNPENGRWQVSETQSNPAPAEWIYTKVAAADWL
jgi:hypothetical protein